MPNNRVFWAVQAAGISRMGSTSYTVVHGLQSLGITTTFNLEQVFEIGQIAIYENIENIPDIEVTMEKVIDGYPLIYHLSTRGYTANTLTGRSNQRCSVALSIFGDTQDSASGTPVSQVTMSGMYVSSVGFTFPNDGNCTESVTLVGNNKVWKSGSYDFTGTLFDNEDEPLALTSGTGGVQRRENVVFATNVATRDTNGAVAASDATILPPDVKGISASGTNDKVTDVFNAHISRISVTTDFGRENINELGRRGPYFRFINFPVDVTTEIEQITSSGDFVDAVESAVSNLNHRSIRIRLEEGLFINLGTKNKLSNITYGGADTGGGQASVVYTYINQNDFVVTHPQDPVA